MSNDPAEGNLSFARWGERSGGSFADLLVLGEQDRGRGAELLSVASRIAILARVVRWTARWASTPSPGGPPRFQELFRNGR
jgi:hypothetical protein